MFQIGQDVLWLSGTITCSGTVMGVSHNGRVFVKQTFPKLKRGQLLHIDPQRITTIQALIGEEEQIKGANNEQQDTYNRAMP